MTKLNSIAVAGLGCLALVGAANAQCPNRGTPLPVTNPSFETPDPDTNHTGNPLGWHIVTGTARYREVGDAGSPAISAIGTPLPAITPHTGTHLMELTTLGGGGFGGFRTDWLNSTLPQPGYYDWAYDWLNGGDIEVSCWYMIPTNAPITGFVVGPNVFTGDAADLKTEVKVICQSVATFEDFSPTSTVNMRGTTNGQWVQFTKHIKRRDITALWRLNAVDPGGCLCVPTGINPSRVSVLPSRYIADGQPTQGTIYFDDFSFTAFCIADVDNGQGNGNPDGGVDINDLLYFLAQFEAGGLGADLSSSDYEAVSDGGVDITDLLFFLQHFESGC